jgi:hypothetical protein
LRTRNRGDRFVQVKGVGAIAGPDAAQQPADAVGPNSPNLNVTARGLGAEFARVRVALGVSRARP